MINGAANSCTSVPVKRCHRAMTCPRRVQTRWRAPMMTLATGCERRRTGGVTLVELTIVVFVLAILMAVAVPSFVRSYKTAQLNAAARAVVTLSQLARVQAAEHQADAQLHVELDRQMFSVTQKIVTTTEDDTTNPIEVTHKTISLPTESRLVAAERTDEP